MTPADEERPALPNAILVAMDFSECSQRALDAALAWKPAAGEVIVLHVVDTNLARQMERFGLSSYDEAVTTMRHQAQERLAALVKERGDTKFETMVADGLPFAEICKIAKDLDCDLVVVGKYGTGPELKDFLFGGTAEKVLRGARQPVLCVP
jgi:nucleotide-binding universal stress UspA family protein